MSLTDKWGVKTDVETCELVRANAVLKERERCIRAIVETFEANPTSTLPSLLTLCIRVMRKPVEEYMEDRKP